MGLIQAQVGAGPGSAGQDGVLLPQHPRPGQHGGHGPCLSAQASLQGTKPPPKGHPPPNPRSCSRAQAGGHGSHLPKSLPQPQQGDCQHAVELGWAAACGASPQTRGGGLLSPQPLLAPPRGCSQPLPRGCLSCNPRGPLQGSVSQTPFWVYGFQGRGVFLQRESPRAASSGKSMGEGGRQAGRHPPSHRPHGSPPAQEGARLLGRAWGPTNPPGWGARPLGFPMLRPKGDWPPGSRTKALYPWPRRQPQLPSLDGEGQPPHPRSPPETRHRR